MGVEQAVFTSMALQAGTSIFSGLEADRAGKKTQKISKKQAALSISEAKRDAGQLRREHRISNARLKLQFLHQGVGVIGSPENILASALNLQDEETKAILSRGATQSQLFELQGQQAKNEGRAALIGGVIGGMSDVLSTGINAKSLGFFNKKMPKTPALPKTVKSTIARDPTPGIGIPTSNRTIFA